MIKPIEIDGREVLSVNEFAKLTNHSPQSIRQLIKYGNRIRKLKTLRVFDKPYILFSEVTEFPFTQAGKGDKPVRKFRLDETGEFYEPYFVNEFFHEKLLS